MELEPRTDLALALAAIAERDGVRALSDPAGLSNRLIACGGVSRRDARLAALAGECGAADRMRERGGEATTTDLRREASRMVDLYGCDRDLAGRIVATWADVGRRLAPIARASAGCPVSAVRFPGMAAAVDDATGESREGTTLASRRTLLSGQGAVAFWWVVRAAGLVGLLAFIGRLYDLL